jgi:predicted nucleic acid-binding protein
MARDERRSLDRVRDEPETACRDPGDSPALGTGVAGAADLLIAVDRDLLALATFDATGIVGRASSGNDRGDSQRGNAVSMRR